jgi:predicted nuclease of restriction endonuclease-like (RecB) superfamily
MSNLDKSYIEVLNQIKEQIRTAQIKAAVSVNAEMLYLYHKIGSTILEQQQEHGWGAKIIDNLASDLRSSFPDMTGFSVRNLKYMRKFAQTYPEFVQAPLAQISWWHHITLLDKINNEQERLWYIDKTIENGWSRNVLVHQIESGLYERQALTAKTTNFALTLPQSQSELARDLIKDPYKFDFLGIGEEAHERDIENALVKHIRKFLLELGTGFAFVGQQYHLEVGGEDFYVDLLFYNLKLRSYIVIELKAVDFKPEHLGQLNFYLNVVDDTLRGEFDNPTIGLLLCKTKNKIIAEYALKDNSKPMGVASYIIPKELPSVEQIQAVLNTES